MCDVCNRKHGKFLRPALEAFLGEPFRLLSWADADGFETIMITNATTGKTFTLVADGDEGGYFHFTPSE